MSTVASDTLDRVAGEFEQEILDDLQDGRTQALALVDSTRKVASEEAEKIITNGHKQGESLKRQIIGTAELGVRNSQLKAMEVVVNEVIETAVRGIEKAPPSRYESAILRLIEEGIEVIGPQAVISCRSRDRTSVENAVRKLGKERVKLSVSPETIETNGGVVLSAGNGSIRYDNTFEARLERMRPTLRKDVGALLARSG
jgi:V/A-type H+-transporting ATPase subunit E